MFRIYSWSATDVGRKRDHNEDSYLVAPDLNLYVVADGMGGHAGGEMASGIAVRTIHKHVHNKLALVDGQARKGEGLEWNPFAHLLAEAVRAACSAVFQKGQAVKELHGMGSTTTAILFHDKHAFVAHVGDSRAYLVRGGRILQLSDDHSLVNEQLRAGVITEAQARNSRFKNVITRCIGFEAEVDVDVIAVEVKADDVFLVCCDGLSNLVTDLEMNAAVNDNVMHRVPDVLVDMANDRGGDDNITVVVCAVVREDDVRWDDDDNAFTLEDAG